MNKKKSWSDYSDDLNIDPNHPQSLSDVHFLKTNPFKEIMKIYLPLSSEFVDNLTDRL